MTGIEINEDIYGEVDDAWREWMSERRKKMVDKKLVKKSVKQSGEGLSFVNIATGKKFVGELPKDVYAIHGKDLGAGITATVVDRAKKGEPDYEKVLVAYMFANGWIEENRKRGNENE